MKPTLELATLVLEIMVILTYTRRYMTIKSIFAVILFSQRKHDIVGGVAENKEKLAWGYSKQERR